MLAKHDSTTRSQPGFPGVTYYIERDGKLNCLSVDAIADPQASRIG
jgi:hypothetical protein